MFYRPSGDQLKMSNFIDGHHGHSGVHVIDHRANTDVRTPYWKWYGPCGEQK